MRANNILTENFLVKHPVDAARVLEKLSAQHCMAFLLEIDEQLAAQLYHYFMPTYAARCLPLMSAGLLDSCAQHALADVCRALPKLDAEQQRSILNKLSARLARQVKNRLSHPTASVGRYFTQNCPVLPASLTTNEALHQLEDMTYDEGCLLNVVDNEHRLLGSIDMARLLSAGRKELLGKLLSPQKRPQILISSLLLELDDHEGWLSHRLLPVVDRNGVYMGELDYETVKQYQREFDYPQHKIEAFGGLLSLAGIYWLSVSWLLECLLGSSDTTDKDKH